MPPNVVNDRTTEEEARRSGVRESAIGLVFGLDVQDNPLVLRGRLAGVYSFLPLEGEQTGLPFGFFGDFVPDPGRDMIKYDLAWNRWLCNEIASLFKQGMDYIARSTAARRTFAATLLDALPSTVTTAGGLGSRFWEEHVLNPVSAILRQGRYYPDNHGELRTLGELVFLDTSLRETLGKDGEELLQQRVSPKYVANEGLGSVKGPAELKSIYDVFQDKHLLEGFRARPDILRKLYRALENLSDYYLNGRPDSKRGGRLRDVPLGDVSFVLGEDGLFHQPRKVLVPADSPTQQHGFLQRMAERQTDMIPLHPSIIEDAKAVAQLRRTGIGVQPGEEELLSRLRQYVESARSERDCARLGTHYPEDLVEATLYLMAKQREPRGLRLVSAEGHLKEPRHLFLPKARLDWELVWTTHYLTGYEPLHALYVDSALLTQFSLSPETVSKFLESIGVHGFSPKGDRDLIEDAAYAIAEARLTNDGHTPRRVHHRQEHGYDLQCEGHCHAVYEVKGMSEPEDVSLEPSETKAASERATDYYLVCVYNLPERTDCIRLQNNLNQIWQPVERARVPRANWLRSG